MSKELDFIVRLAQKYLELVPVIVFGSGASAAYGIPTMGQLRDHLLTAIRLEPEHPSYSLYQKFMSTLATTDLETSLQKVMLNDKVLLEAVIKETWDYINKADMELFEHIAKHQVELAHATLFRFLFNSTHKVVQVVTTNYDRVIEYACDLAGLAHWTGFTNGYLRFRDASVQKMRDFSRRARTVLIWKVHGSLDWFKTEHDTLIALPPRPTIPDGFFPVIVPPGATKYQAALQEPFRSAIAGADTALQEARAYLCVGYGFNDDHVQPKLVERVRRDGTPLIVLARTLTQSARNLLLDGRCKNFLALEQVEPNSTKAYLPEYPNGLVLEGHDLWSLKGFLDHTIADIGGPRDVAV